MVSQVERYYPRTRRAVGPVSQTDRFYDDARNDVRCPYADELGELDEVKKHLGRTDNPHGVTAEQLGLASAYVYKGTVATKDDLPKDGNAVGDVWNVEEGGMNFAWTGEGWDALGGVAELEDYYTKEEVDEKLAKKLSLTGGTVTGSLTVNASVTASSFKIPQGSATHIGEVVSIKNGPTMAGAVGLVYERIGANPSGNTRKRFMGVSGGDTDTRLYIGDGDIPNAESGLTTVFGLYLPDDRTWARHDLWFTNKLGDAQGPRTWWGLVQDGDELRIVKDKGTPKAYLPLSGGTMSGDIKFTQNAAIVMANGTKVFYQEGASSYIHVGYVRSNYFPICDLAGGPIDKYFAAKKDVYTKTEVDTLVAQAVANAKAELLEQLKGLYAPLSSVQATINGQTYRWAYSETYGTFAMQAVEA